MVNWWFDWGRGEESRQGEVSGTWKVFKNHVSQAMV